MAGAKQDRGYHVSQLGLRMYQPLPSSPQEKFRTRARDAPLVPDENEPQKAQTAHQKRRILPRSSQAT
jgi:hypothetical protein